MLSISQPLSAGQARKGVVGREEHRAQVLVLRQDLTGADRSSAHVPEMKPEQKQEQAVTPQQEQSLDLGLGL
jgi:hypothetical protein